MQPRRYNVKLLQGLLILCVLAAFAGAQGNPVSASGAVAAQAAAAADLIFADGFESGNLSAWSPNATDSGDLGVASAAALKGSRGLRAVIDDNKTIYVTGDQPNAEPRYRARFYFDPNSIKMASGDAFLLLNGYKGTSTASLAVEFRQYSGAYQVRARLLNDSYAWKATSWLALSNSSHYIELDWRAASGVGANNGGLKLWIDGVQKAILSGVDNDTQRIDRVRLGAPGGIDAGTRGTYYLDAFESRRQTYIGPAGSSGPAPTPTHTSPPAATSTPSPIATRTPNPQATQTPPTGSSKIVYAPSNEDFANPERGFLKQSSVFPDQSLSVNKVSVLQASDSLVWIYFRLDNYRDRLIDQTGLNTIRSVFSTARNRGLKLVIRFVYNPGPGSTSNPDLAQPDAPIDLVLQHIDQLKPILVENADVIAVVEAGFVGHWGEWHSTKYLHPLEYRRAIVDALLQALPKNRMIQLRYPRYKEIFYQGPLTTVQAFSGTDQSRVGFHNDCFLAGTNDSNTYSSTTPQLPKQISTYCDGQDQVACWKGFVAQESLFTPSGGETCQYNPPRTDCANALQEMGMLHWSFLNNGYRAEVLNSWTSGGCMDTIRRRLGYRFVLKEATIPTSVKPGGSIGLNIRLGNQGFAAMYNPRPVYIVLQGSGNRFEIPVTGMDPRRWWPGEEQALEINVNVPANIPAGTYKLALWLPDESQTLRNNPAYSVRFANTSVWDSATGMNILSSNLQVTP
jgi:hypothetical protein